MHSVEVQLKCFGLAKYKSLMEQGFPNRLEFGQLLSMYDIRIIKEKHFHIALLLKSMGLDKHDYRIGHTRVCLRPLKPHDLDRILTPSEHDIVQVKNTYEKKLAIYGRWSFLVKAALANQSKIITARWVLSLCTKTSIYKYIPLLKFSERNHFRLSFYSIETM